MSLSPYIGMDTVLGTLGRVNITLLLIGAFSVLKSKQTSVSILVSLPPLPVPQTLTSYIEKYWKLDEAVNVYVVVFSSAVNDPEILDESPLFFTLIESIFVMRHPPILHCFQITKHKRYT